MIDANINHLENDGYTKTEKTQTKPLSSLGNSGRLPEPPYTIKPALNFLLNSKYGNELTLRNLSVLLMCAEGTQTIRGMARRMDTYKPAVTRAADRLEELGLLVRTVDPKDRRSVLVTLTPTGKRFAKNFV